MKLTSLFHLSLMTLAVGLTADLAAAATVQPNAQSSASTEADAKEARARHNASESEPQQPLTLTFKLSDGSIRQLTFNKKESFSVLANLLKTNIEELRKCAAQSQREVTAKVYEAITIINITEREQTAEAVEGTLTATKDLSLEGAMAWYAAYMQAVANKQIELGKHANLNGAVGACVVKLIEENLTKGWTDSQGHYNEMINAIRIDNIIKLLLQDAKLTSIQITTEHGVCDAAQYMFLLVIDSQVFCPQYNSLKKLQSINKKGLKLITSKLFNVYVSLLPEQMLLESSRFTKKYALTDKELRKVLEAYKKQWAEESEKEKKVQTKSASAVEQQSIAPANIDNSQSNPPPAQPRNVFTKAKNFFCAHSWAKYTVYALAGAAAIYGGYRLYKHVNMRKLARYAGNWA